MPDGQLGVRPQSDKFDIKFGPLRGVNMTALSAATVLAQSSLVTLTTDFNTLKSDPLLMTDADLVKVGNDLVTFTTNFNAMVAALPNGVAVAAAMAQVTKDAAALATLLA